MDCNSRVSETVEEEGGLLPKGDVIKLGLLESDATLGGGFVEDDDFGLERRDCQTVPVTGGLGGMDETLYGGTCVGNEAKVVDVEKDSEEGHDVRVWESQVGMVTLDGVNEVGDVEPPKEGRETAAFR